MSAPLIIGNVYVGRYGSANARSTGSIELGHGVARVGDTITLSDGHYRVTHVHWVSFTYAESDGLSTAIVDLYVQPTNARIDLLHGNLRAIQRAMSGSSADWLPFAEGHLDCRHCEHPIPVPVLSRLVGGPQDLHLALTPDLSQLWAHARTHDARVGDGGADDHCPGRVGAEVIDRK
jgi:hypothetical protein